MAGLIIVVVVVIVGSGLCSSSEAALLSVPVLRVRQRADQGEARAKTLLAIKERVSRPITTIVVFNNIFNIVGSILAGNQATDVFGSTSLGIVSGVLTFLIIVFSEIIPKTLGERFAEPMSLAIAPAISALTTVFTPIIWLLEHLTRPFSGSSSLADTDEAEIRFLATLGRKQGVIEHDEAEMIQRVFRLNDMRAEEIMTPRVLVTAIEGSEKLADVIETIADSPHSRLIIYDDSLDNVVGICLRGSLLAEFARGHRDKKVAELARPAHFVDETMQADDLLRLFQKTREHLVIVVDSYGGTAGVVTLEDVVELVTGDIQDETDARVDLKAAAKRRRERLLQSGGKPGAETEGPPQA